MRFKLPYARHYNPRFVYILPTFKRQFLCFQGGFLGKFPYVWLSLVLLLISNLTNGLRLHQFLVTKSAEANKSVRTDANRAH